MACPNSTHFFRKATFWGKNGHTFTVKAELLFLTKKVLHSLDKVTVDNRDSAYSLTNDAHSLGQRGEIRGIVCDTCTCDTYLL